MVGLEKEFSFKSVVLVGGNDVWMEGRIWIELLLCGRQYIVYIVFSLPYNLAIGINWLAMPGYISTGLWDQKIVVNNSSKDRLIVVKIAIIIQWLLIVRFIYRDWLGMVWVKKINKKM